MEHSPRFLRLVEDVKAKVLEIGVEEVKARLGGSGLRLVDVREESEFAAGHIHGATHIGKGVIERDIERHVPDPSSEIILYCAGGTRSALAARSLGELGYTNVKSLRGGFTAWKRAGNPTDKVSVAPKKARG